MNVTRSDDQPLLDAALAYARAGIPVLRLKPGTKEPSTAHGLSDATTDLEQIAQWWDDQPDSNIGIRPTEHQFVIDVESVEGHGVDGHATLADLIADDKDFGPLPDDCPTVQTATGGLHIWLSYDGGPLYGSYGPGVEIKRHGRYLVAPPSIINGKPYRWLVPLSGEPVAAPKNWRERARKVDRAPRPKLNGHKPISSDINEPWIKGGVDRELTFLASTPEGGAPIGGNANIIGRNNWLNIVGVRTARLLLNTTGTPREWLRDQLIDACYANGLADDDGITSVEKTINSAFAYADRQGPAPMPEAKSKPDNVIKLPDVSHTDSEEDTPVLAVKLLTRSDLLTLPDPEPLIDNVLDQGTIALLYGKWSTGKTFIALDWAASVATGRTWFDRETEQRRVLYVLGEGAFGFKGRVQAWETGWRTMISDESLGILPVPVNLMNTVDVGNLRALIDWGGYDFVILDTLSRCMVGADENSAKDSGVVVDAMTKLLAATPNGHGVVLGVHHPGKDGQTLRGSSAFEGAADTVYFTGRDDNGWISLTREKRKDGPEHDHHLLKIDPMLDSAVLSAGRPECILPTQFTDTVRKLANIVHQVISEQPDHSVESTRKLFAAMRLADHEYRDNAIRLAVDYLVLSERLAETPGKRGAVGYRTVSSTAQDDGSDDDQQDPQPETVVEDSVPPQSCPGCLHFALYGQHSADCTASHDDCDE